MFELGKVTFYILREPGKSYEATVIDFGDYTDLLKVTDTSDYRAEHLQKGSSIWFAVHSCLSEKGILRGK